MILWVDDDISPTLRPFLDEVEENGYSVIMARNPDEMFKALSDQSDSISLIIMDIMLPTGSSLEINETKKGVITGLILLKKLQTIDRYKDIPILVFTILLDQDVVDWTKKMKIKYLIKQKTRAIELVEAIEKMQIKKDHQ